MKIQLSNRDQAWHLHQALRGHCEVEMLPGVESCALEVIEPPASDHGSVLRRLDAWQREFGVDSIAIELGGRDYVMSKTSKQQTLARTG